MSIDVVCRELVDKIELVLALLEPACEKVEGYKAREANGETVEINKDSPSISMDEFGWLNEIALKIYSLAGDAQLRRELPQAWREGAYTKLCLPGYMDNDNGRFYFNPPPRWFHALKVVIYDANKKAEQPKIDDSNWVRQVEAARDLFPNENEGTRKMKVRRLIQSDDLGTNGKTGNDCRVDPTSILAYCDRKGITYNET